MTPGGEQTRRTAPGFDTLSFGLTPNAARLWSTNLILIWTAPAGAADALPRNNPVFLSIDRCGILSTTDQSTGLPRISWTASFALATYRFPGFLNAMTYLDQEFDPAHIDSVRRTTFTRSPSRPSAKLRQPTPEDRKAVQRARGRLRQAAYRCALDTKRKPEASVVGMALLAAVATRSPEQGFDALSAGIVSSAFADLVDRGYSRSEIEAVFRRIRKNLMPAPDFGSNK